MRPRRAVDAQRHAAQVPAHVVLERVSSAQAQTSRVSNAACACCESGALLVLVCGCAPRRQAICPAQGGGGSREYVPGLARQRGGAAAREAPAGVVAAVVRPAAQPELLT